MIKRRSLAEKVWSGECLDQVGNGVGTCFTEVPDTVVLLLRSLGQFGNEPLDPLGLGCIFAGGRYHGFGHGLSEGPCRIVVIKPQD